MKKLFARFILLGLLSAMGIFVPWVAQAAQGFEMDPAALGQRQGFGDPEIDAACDEVAEVPIPKADLPPKSFTCAKSSLDYYDPASGKADFQKARWCAYQERKNGQNFAPDLVGSGILMSLYANGLGVPRNLPLATRFVCEYGGAPVAIESRIEELRKMEKTRKRKNFGVCEDFTSAIQAVTCAEHDQDLARKRRQIHWKQMQVAWTQEQKKSFAKLTKLAGLWFEKAAENEMKPGAAPSWNTRWWMDAEASRWKRFSRLLDLVLQDRLLSLNYGDPKDRATYLHRTMRNAYSLLNKEVYPYDGNGDGSTSPFGEINSGAVQDSQALWEKYRQSWLNFYHALYPGQADAPLNTCLLQSRIEEWNGFVQENRPGYSQDVPDDGPSFSCTKANTQVEKTICANTSLRKLDHDLTNAFHEVLKSQWPCDPRRRQLMEEQRVWLHKRDACEASVGCLKGIYQRRIVALEKM